ncbi:HDIG domain-containing protein, partial [candidate division WWE3 bacterium]|nr:HDIG domain-containing protein [candidate division WWE3 bacterium]
MAKRYFVTDLNNSVGLVDETDFAVVKSDRKVTRNDQPYQDIVLRDKSGEVGAKIWSDNLEYMEDHKAGDVVHVEFEVRDYKGNIELTVRKLSKLAEYDCDDFIPVSENVDGEKLKSELAKRIDSVRDLHLRQLLDAFFDDAGFYESFTNSPAGMYVHHDYRHGLLQHTLEMLTITDSLCLIYPDMDRDLITVGVLFHDVGKIRELKVNPAGVTDYTREGQMVGHIGIGLLMLEK